MVVTTRCALLALALVAQLAPMQTSAYRARANPIRNVVKMLQDMEKRIAQEGEEGEKLYKKYKCYCTSGGEELADSISAAEDKIPAIEGEIDAAAKEKAQLDKAVGEAQADREAAKTTVALATATRKKEAAAYAETVGASNTTIAALKKAIVALRKGAYGEFLQTGAAVTLRNVLSTHGQLLEEAAMDAPDVFSFLSGQIPGTDYAPQGGEVIGILEQIGKEIANDLHVTVEKEEQAIQAYEAVTKATGKEIVVTTEQIERKMARSADLGISIVTMENDVSVTQAALQDDKKFAEDLDATCKTKASEWEEDTKTRKEEVVAIEETIAILNDDGALEIFKSTLPSAAMSFLQLGGLGTAKPRGLQIHLLQRLNFIGLALKGNTVGLDKVVKMIDTMAEVIEQEQTEDETKREYCLAEIDATEDKTKKLNSTSRRIEKATADTEAVLAAVTEKIAGLAKGIAALDQQVADASEQRKTEHAYYLKLTEDDTAAKKLLDLAKNRLFEFYTPQLHTTSTTPFASRGDEIYSNFGGASFAQVATKARRSSSSMRAATAAPAPEAPGPYTKKAEESTGVIAMLGLLIKDLDTELTQAETNEQHNQEAYTALVADFEKKKADDSKALTESKVAKTNLEAELQSQNKSQQDVKKAIFATTQYIGQLRAECDWLLQYFKLRTDARASDTKTLVNAKAVLNGASYSLL